MTEQNVGRNSHVIIETKSVLERGPVNFEGPGTVSDLQVYGWP